MRTPLLITAAIAVVASTAAAANFDINNADTTLDDISSGDSSIADCTDGLTLDVLHSADYDDDFNDWHVTGVRVAGDTTALLDSCTDMALSVAIDNDDTNLTVLGPVVLTTDSVTGGSIELPVLDETDPIPVRSATEVTAIVERNLDAIAALAPTGPTEPAIQDVGFYQNQFTHRGTIAQEFVPNTTGWITRIDFTQMNAAATTLTLIEGDTLDGAVLGSETKSVIATADPDGNTDADDDFSVFELDTPILVEAGQSYIFSLSSNLYRYSYDFGVTDLDLFIDGVFDDGVVARHRIFIAQ